MIKYPKPLIEKEKESLQTLNPALFEAYSLADDHFYEWCILERIKSKKSIRMKIGAPHGQHDDGCLAHDTLIPLTNGDKMSMKEISKLDFNKQDYYTYSVDLENNLIVPGKIKRAWKTGNKKVIKIILDNKKFLECTEDHPVMMRDGSYKEAQDLKSGDSLMPLYRKYSKGKYQDYELIKDLNTGGYKGTHKMFAWGENKNIDKKVVHHKVKMIIDENKSMDVYDLEIEKYHNFAIDNGIFVHNCNSDALAIYCVNKMGNIGADMSSKFNFLLSRTTFFS